MLPQTPYLSTYAYIYIFRKYNYYEEEEGKTSVEFDLWLATKGLELERRRTRVAQVCAAWGEEARKVENDYKR